MTINSHSYTQHCSTSDFCLVIRFVSCRRHSERDSGETEGGRHEDLPVYESGTIIKKYLWNMPRLPACVSVWSLLLEEADAGQVQESGPQVDAVVK